MNWAAKYVGLPFDETDLNCWGLVRRVLIRECGVYIDAFAGVKSWDSPRIDDIVAAELQRDDWRRVGRADVKAFDVALLWVVRRLFGRDTQRTRSHIGIVAPGGRLLHVERETHAVCVPLDRVADRVDCFYRHRLLA